MPANITSIIECAFSPVKDVNLPDGVKIVIGFGPDPDAEPFVLPEDPDEDEDEDDQDEDGEESGEDGGDDDDGEKAGRLSRSSFYPATSYANLTG